LGPSVPISPQEPAAEDFLYFIPASSRFASAISAHRDTFRQTTAVLTPHEREKELCFWSRPENSERIYKKTHAMKLSNDNRAYCFGAGFGLPAITAVSTAMLPQQGVEESPRICAFQFKCER
jgi:hypothetical protein